MAKPRGLYTPVYASLPRHAKVQAAADTLHCDRHKLLGHLVTFWTWCLDGAGERAVLTASVVALGAEWPARQAQRFADALADAGLLERIDGGFLVHEWGEYGGKVAAIQGKDRDRHSAEIPQKLPGTSSLDETRRDEIRSEIDPPLPPASIEARSVYRDLAESIGVHSPPIGWAENWLKTRPLAAITEAIGKAREANASSTKYVDRILEKPYVDRGSGSGGVRGAGAHGFAPRGGGVRGGSPIGSPPPRVAGFDATGIRTIGAHDGDAAEVRVVG